MKNIIDFNTAVGILIGVFAAKVFSSCGCNQGVRGIGSYDMNVRDFISDHFDRLEGLGADEVSPLPVFGRQYPFRASVVRAITPSSVTSSISSTVSQEAITKSGGRGRGKGNSKHEGSFSPVRNVTMSKGAKANQVVNGFYPY